MFSNPLAKYSSRIQFRNAGLLTILWLSLLFFLSSATYLIKLPGLYYDETLFVNAALGGINNDFIHKRLFGIPLMLMPYIGALKAYIYYPIFQFFGVSPESIRLPCVAISLLTLLVSFLLGQLLLNRWLAVLLVVLMATDPAFIYTTRLDWGPVVLMNFFKLASLFLLFKILNESSCSKIVRLTWLLALVLILGLFDKLNFIWFVIALSLSTITIYHSKVRQISQACGQRLIKPVSVFLLLFSLIIVFLVLPVLKLGNDSLTGDSQGWAQRFHSILSIYQSTISGQSIYSFIFSQSLAYPSKINLISVVLFIITILVLMVQGLGRLGFAWNQSLKSQNEPAIFDDLASLYLFFLILFIAIYGQILLTKQAGGPHHVMMLFPVYHLLNILSISIILSCFKQWRLLSIISLVIVSLLLCGIISSQIKVIDQYNQALSSGKHFSNLWSPSIYQLSDFLNDQGKDVNSIISVDWGIHNQLFALSRPEYRQKYLDLWPSFKELNRSPDQEIENLFEEKFHQKSVLVITHAPATETMEGTRNNFLKFANKFSRNIQLKAQFFSGNKILFEVYWLNEIPTQNP